MGLSTLSIIIFHFCNEYNKAGAPVLHGLSKFLGSIIGSIGVEFFLFFSFFVLVGKYSLELYITHVALIQLFRLLGLPVSNILCYIGLIAIAVVLSLGLHWLTDRILRRQARSLADSRLSSYPGLIIINIYRQAPCGLARRGAHFCERFYRLVTLLDTLRAVCYHIS